MSRSSLAVLLLLPLYAAACDGGTDPEPIDPDALVGTWVLDPVPSLTCDFGETAGTVTITFDSLTVLRPEGDALRILVPYNTAGHYTLGTQNGTRSFLTPLNEQTGRFMLSDELPATWDNGAVALDARIAFSIEGRFRSDDELAVDFEAATTGPVTFSANDQVFDGACTVVDEETSGSPG